MTYIIHSLLRSKENKKMNDGKIQLDVGAVNQPRTLFKPGSWLSKVDFINHLILFNNVLITVLSEKEGGKTSFSTLLQSNLDQQIKSVLLTATPPYERQTIINSIATRLHLNNDSETNIDSIVTQINERKAHVVLIIDDAQNVPEPLIKEMMLSIKNQGNFGFFHLCLISDYSLVATLNNLTVEPFNNLVHTIELGALSESETRTYVLQRAMSARLINKPLSDVQFKQFYQLTKGNLAKINATLESFIFKCSTQKQSNKMSLLKRAGTAASLAAAAGLSYLYLDDHFHFSTKIDMAMLTTPPAINELVDEHFLQDFPPFASQIASWNDSSTRQLVHYELPKKQNLDELVDEEQNLNTVALIDKVVVIPTVNAVKANQMLVAKEESTVSIQPVLSESKLVSVSDALQNKVVANQSGKGLYTIQLVASHHISDVHHFRQINKLFAETQIRHFTNAKGTWYILTIGEFNNRNMAQLKVKNLPQTLSKLNPWVRPVAGLSNVG